MPYSFRSPPKAPVISRGVTGEPLAAAFSGSTIGRADAKATVSLGCSQPRTTHGQSLEPDHSCPMQDSSNSLSLLSGPYRLGHDLFRATLQLTKFSFCVALFLWKPGWYCGLRLVHLRPLPFPFALCRHFPNKSLTLLILSWCLLPRGR